MTGHLCRRQVVDDPFCTSSGDCLEPTTYVVLACLNKGIKSLSGLAQAIGRDPLALYAWIRRAAIPDPEAVSLMASLAGIPHELAMSDYRRWAASSEAIAASD